MASGTKPIHFSMALNHTTEVAPNSDTAVKSYIFSLRHGIY